MRSGYRLSSVCIYSLFIMPHNEIYIIIIIIIINITIIIEEEEDTKHGIDYVCNHMDG
jgi:hypothetical protein